MQGEKGSNTTTIEVVIMSNANYPIEEIQDLVTQLVNLTELIANRPDSLDEDVVHGLIGAQYETVQCLKGIVEG